MIPIPTILLSALIMVESSGNDRAIGRMGELGPLQIMPATLRDINRISGRRFTRSDAFHRETAIQMATIYLNHYATEKRLGRKPTFRDYALTRSRRKGGKSLPPSNGTSLSHRDGFQLSTRYPIASPRTPSCHG